MWMEGGRTVQFTAGNTLPARLGRIITPHSDRSLEIVFLYSGMSPQFVSCSARARPASRLLSPLLFPPTTTVSPGPSADMNRARKSVKRKNVLTAISLVSKVLTNTVEGAVRTVKF